ncbi:MAG TPA: ATP synthase F1 subunit gamma [Polyangiaceae bacterium]|jgi:F-type H+-transporting ATPase subunit gamma|nr:ATP synthase F1 subunit gamma [Polyangiaceae bacterium]
MPSLKGIRKRITSTKATQKITRAMKMVAGARLTRAQQRIVAMRPYAVKTAEVLQSVARTMGAAADAQDEPVHPLLAKRPEQKTLFLVFSADRGLCGALNTNINKASERLWKEKAAAQIAVSFATAGRKGREYLARREGHVVQDFPRIYDGLDLDKARLIAGYVVPKFVRGEYDAIYLVFSEFKSAITQKVTIDRLLPLVPMNESAPAGADAGGNAPNDFLYEPHQKALLERLVPMYVEISIYRALLESQASFFGAQMTAMDAATRNAKEMIARLTLEYNRARQAGITKELMEIVGGAEALKE